MYYVEEMISEVTDSVICHAGEGIIMQQYGSNYEQGRTKTLVKLKVSTSFVFCFVFILLPLFILVSFVFLILVIQATRDEREGIVVEVNREAIMLKMYFLPLCLSLLSSICF